MPAAPLEPVAPERAKTAPDGIAAKAPMARPAPPPAPPHDIADTAGVTNRISAGRARIASTIIVTPTRTSR
ncbi:hypothetical protein ACFQL5_19555, partial [Aquipuribacter hungaricus]|uniref:hypothetical protein n=1 Tax=Aquipuribacter hungaricus TaxID=545624 RepID=UPI003616DD23